MAKIDESKTCPKCGNEHSEFIESRDTISGDTYPDRVSGHGVHQAFRCPGCQTEYEVRYTDDAKIIITEGI